MKRLFFSFHPPRIYHDALLRDEVTMHVEERLVEFKDAVHAEV